MWERIKRLMFGYDVTSHLIHSRLMDEFDKFATKKEEALESMYERLTALVNIMDRNNVRSITVSINTKFLNWLQPEWSKYVTMARHNQNGDTVSYDVLYDSLVQFEQHVLASKSRKAAKNHDLLALIAHSNAFLSQSHANSFHSPQPYYVTHPSSIFSYEDKYQGELQRDSREDKLTTATIPYCSFKCFFITISCKFFPFTHPSSIFDYEDKYQGELQRDSREDKLTTATMLLARAITQKFSTPTNTCLRTSLNTRNQAVIQDGQVDIQTKNASYSGNEQEDRYLDDIVDLKGKLSSHDLIVCKMGQSIQTIHMLGKEPNKVYDHFLKAGLGYKYPEHLKKAIATQPKMYDGERLYNANLLINSPDSEKTLEDAIKRKNVNTKFEKSKTSGTLLFVTSFPKNIAIKAKKVSNSKVNADRSKPVTSHPIPKNEQGVESFNSVRRPKSKDTKSNNRALKNTNAKSLTAHVQRMSRSVSIDSNKGETMNLTIFHANKSVLNTKNNVTVSSCSTSNIQEKKQLSRSRCMHSLREFKSLFKFLSENLQDFGTMPIFKRTFSQDLDLLEQHLTKDILSQTDCNTTLTNLKTKFKNAFNSEFKERMRKYTRFDAQSFKDAMIFNMDSIGKYVLEIILHQQRTLHFSKHKKLMQRQEDHSNPILTLNVDSLNVDSVVIQNTCFEKDDSNSETASSKSVKESSLDSATKDVHAIKYKMSKAKERCMAYFRSLHLHLRVLSKEDLKGTRIKHGFKRAFMSLFGQDVDIFTNKYFVEYTGIEVKHFRDTLLQHMGNVKKFVAKRTCHQRQYDRRVNKRQMHMQK
nr:hypothetical protein [Tanacetum cinerariifolium]